MSECTHDCSTCSENCSSRNAPQDFHIEPHEMSHIKKVIGIVSGKGGVGKSLVTSMLAVEAQRRNLKAAILDADITGPSIPKAFGIKEKAKSTGDALLPVITKTGIKIMSVNLLLEDETRSMARSRYRGGRKAVLERGHLGRRRLYVRRHASGNRRRSAYRLPVYKARRDRRCCIAAGACRDDSRKSR